MNGRTGVVVSLFSAFLLCAGGMDAQSNTAPVSTLTADYPMDRPGIFIQSQQWLSLASQYPTKTRTARGFAASLSYGLVPAKIVAEYAGDHASAQISGGQPIICICHMVGLPGNPVIVRLHPKKGARELDGGKMIVYPVVGGSKVADANKTDLIDVEISQPDPQVWLIRSRVPLPAGEYALMLGTQNLNIFPFSITP